jgi:hypothetical protein
LKETGDSGKAFLVGIWHLQGIERGVPRTARQSGGLQQTKQYGGQKSNVQEIISKHETASFNIVSLRHKKSCDKENEEKKVLVRGTYTDPVSAP